MTVLDETCLGNREIVVSSKISSILESFYRFCRDEKDCVYEIFSIVSSARAWGSVILEGKRGSGRQSTTRGRSGGNKLSDVRSFIILLSGEGLTSFNNDNSTNFSGEKKKDNEELTIREKNFKSNLVLVVGLVLQSKGLYSHNSWTVNFLCKVCTRAAKTIRVVVFNGAGCDKRWTDLKRKRYSETFTHDHTPNVKYIIKSITL